MIWRSGQIWSELTRPERSVDRIPHVVEAARTIELVRIDVELDARASMAERDARTGSNAGPDQVARQRMTQVVEPQLRQAMSIETAARAALSRPRSPTLFRLSASSMRDRCERLKSAIDELGSTKGDDEIVTADERSPSELGNTVCGRGCSCSSPGLESHAVGAQDRGRPVAPRQTVSVRPLAIDRFAARDTRSASRACSPVPCSGSRPSSRHCTKYEISGPQGSALSTGTVTGSPSAG